MTETEGQRLRTWREQRLKLTQRELGERLRPPVPQPTVARYESGERRIPPGLWQALERLEQELASAE